MEILVSRKRTRNAIGVMLLSIALGALAGQAAGQEYYRSFRTFVATNSWDRPILFPLLVDTNNTGLKTTNVLCSFDRLKTEGGFGRLRLGMSMEDVVSAWGKPILAWKWCGGGGPHFKVLPA